MTESKELNANKKEKEETIRIPLSEYKALQRKNELLKKELAKMKKRTMELSKLNKNDKKKMERCKSIYQFIDSHPGCKRNEIIESTGLPEGTIKRYLYNMSNCSLPYIEREGKGPATTYKISFFGFLGPAGPNNQKNLRKHLKEWYDLREWTKKHGKTDYPSLDFIENPSPQLKEILKYGNRTILFGPKNIK